MNTFRTQLKKYLLVILAFVVLSGISTISLAAQFGSHYDSAAAVNYAQEHWDDNVGVCDQFVKACLRAGGVEILSGGVESIKNALVDTKLGYEHTLEISADGVHALASENPHIQPGDILFFYCEECDKYIHTAIIGGTNNAGYLYSYAHNPGWNQVDWFGNFTHTLENGQQHRKCHRYIVVTMNRENYSHIHNFTSDLYEENHPHKMYARCSCGLKYYLGWNATVSYCTSCNPPAADIPLASVSMKDDKIFITWTTVDGALEYQVLRSKNKDGTYFNLYSALGTKFTNSSFDLGTTYYFKVVAVLEKDSNGNVTRSSTSDIVSITPGGVPAPTPTAVPPAADVPLVTVSNEDNKALVTWTTVEGALEYQVWRSRSEDGTYFNLYSTPNTKMLNSSVEAGNTYYYKVVAVLEKDTEGNILRSVTSAVTSFSLTGTPTATPTAVPTAAPTAVPTATPTAVPTAAPTAVPTATPTAVPTATPTAVPTATPTAVPTATPTAVPTATPTAVPTATPTAVPTATPTIVKITTYPKTTYTQSGFTAKATVKATGDGLTYAWYVKNTGAKKFTKTSASTATYSVKMSGTVKNRQVYCIVKDKYGNTVKSNTVTLRMAASITTQPKTSYTQSGSTAKATVKATGDGLTYAWYVKNTGAKKFTKTSASTATYSVKMSGTVKNRQVYCIVKDKYGNTVKSNTVTLRMAASITTQPKTSYTQSGSTAKATVKATGDGLTYAWYVKNTGAKKFTKTSASTATYSVKMSGTVKNRQVYCIVKDKYGNTVKSNTVTLRMAASITTQPKTSYTQSGSTAKATVKATGDGLTYTWYVKNTGAKKFTKTSASTATYSVKMSGTVKNRQVYCIVKDKYGNTVKSNTVTLRMAASITTQPKTSYTQSGSTAKATVKATGDGLTYAWYVKNTGAKKFTKISASTATYSVKMSGTVKNRQVYCIVKDKYGNTVKSKTVELKMK